jgi:Bardet-Biedl syndrome 1 protein
MAFINENKEVLEQSGISSGERFCHRNYITCTAKIAKLIEGECVPSYLVLGTENSEVLILDKSCMGIQQVIQLKSVPVILAVQGGLEMDYKILVACRNGCTYQIKNGKVSSSFKI